MWRTTASPRASNNCGSKVEFNASIAPPLVVLSRASSEINADLLPYHRRMKFTRFTTELGGNEFPVFEGSTRDRNDLEEVLTWCSEYLGPSASSFEDMTSRATAWMYRKSSAQSYVVAFGGEEGAFLFHNRWC